MSATPNIIRYKYDTKSCLSPDLYQVGWAIFNEPVHDTENLPAHIHKDCFEICYIAHGNVDWFVEDTVYEVQAGQIFITFPGEKHGGRHGVMNPCELYWVQFRFPTNGGFPALTPRETALLSAKFSAIHPRIVPAGTDAPFFFKQIIDQHRMPSEYGTIVVKTALTELLVSILKSFETNRKQTEQVAGIKFSPQISRACDLIKKNLGTELKIDEIAAETGLSTTSFYQHFSEEVHLTPGEYLTQQRLRLAKELLLNSKMSITSIAHHVGYSSSQYFSTIFKKVTGLTPKQFRKGII